MDGTALGSLFSASLGPPGPHFCRDRIVVLHTGVLEDRVKEAVIQRRFHAVWDQGFRSSANGEEGT